MFGIINKYGILYFYNENGIYFFDNNNIKNILSEKKIESSFLFYLKSYQNIFKVSLLEIKLHEKIENNNANNKIPYLVIIIKGEKGNYIIYININNLFKEINRQEPINLKDIFNIQEEKPIENNDSKENIGKNNLIISNDILFSLYSQKKDHKDNNDKEKDINNNEDSNKSKESIKSEEEKNENMIEEIPLDLDFVLNVESMIFQQYYNPSKSSNNKIIYIEEKFKNIISFNLNTYLIQNLNGKIIIMNNYNIVKIIKENVTSINYNDKISIILLISDNKIICLNSINFNEMLYSIFYVFFGI